MGIKVEFNPDLALRDISEFRNGNRKTEECIPESLEAGKTHPFLKRDQRPYRLRGQIPLIGTKGDEVLSRPKAVVGVTEVTHRVENGEIYTRGLYRVDEVISDDTIRFECFDPVGTRE